MTRDGRHRDRYLSRLPDDWLDVVRIVGLVMAVYALAYQRGHLVGSGMTAEEYARVMAETGPYWPMVLFALGMILMCASLLTTLVDRRQA